VIDALEILTDDFQVKDAHLVIVGDGPSRKSLESQVAARGLEARVRFVRDVPHAELYLWYNAADVFCLASSREGWPNVVVEALACGTPVVATSVWGIPEIIRSDELGLLTPRTPLDIARTLRVALQKPWRSRVISDYGRTRTWERVARSLSQIFQSVFERASLATGEGRRALTESRP
jgi:teichuronic acid biosynthesis glycosyltransferase TuaC